MCGVHFGCGPHARRHEPTCRGTQKHSIELGDLSDPVILLILKNLDVVHLCAAAGASRRMRALAKDFSLWRNVVVEIPQKVRCRDEAESIIEGVVVGYLGEETKSLTIRAGLNNS